MLTFVYNTYTYNTIVKLNIEESEIQQNANILIEKFIKTCVEKSIKKILSLDFKYICVSKEQYFKLSSFY